MLKKVFLLSVCIFSFSLLSCGSAITRLSEQENNLHTQGGYESYLALEYLRFSRNLAAVGKHGMSKYFAKKGLAVSSGVRVAPESPIEWRADPAQREEMILMQKRLEIVLTESRIKFYLPVQLAHLSYLYDCWISRESQEIFRADELAQCRVRFGRLLEEVERYIDDFEKDKQPKIKISEPEFRRFEIIFDLDSFKFNDRANQDLIEVIKYLGTLNGAYRLLLVGNADRSGNEVHNQSLAITRADTVRNYLIKNGIFPHQIEMRAEGEDFPDIITKDGVQQRSNRTVGIYVVKGMTSLENYPLPLIESHIYRDDINKAKQERGMK